MFVVVVVVVVVKICPVCEPLGHITVILPHSLFACFEQMLTVDLSVSVSGLDQLDSVDSDGLESDSLRQSEAIADLISQWEAELLQEKLQELLHTDDEDAETQVQRTNIYTYT